jgi:ferredoxin-type protein NapG
MSDMMEAEQPAPEPIGGRRAFFQRGLAKLVQPLAGYIEAHLDLTGLRLYLRPPGALPEKDFLATCYRCGNCVNVCPVKAIRPIKGVDERLAGTPTIEPEVTACVACQTVECTKACPSGALQLLSDPRQIRMGLAGVNHRVCLRSRGEDCTICVDKCPIDGAIRVCDGGAIEVIESVCTGCGVCQQHCPTRPKAVTVRII